MGDVDVEIRLTWRKRGPGVEDFTEVVTHTPTARDWRSHWAVHAAVRQLVALVTLAPASLFDTKVQHVDVPELSLGGQSFGVTWRHLEGLAGPGIGPGVGISKTDLWTRGLADFQDLGAAGMQKWLDLHAQYERAIDPGIASIYEEGATVEVQMLYAGIGAEALRYIERVSMGHNAKEAATEPLWHRLQATVASAGDPFTSLVGDGELWSRRVADAYNSVKHADRTLPRSAALSWAARSANLLIRMRLLQRIGVDSGTFAALTDKPWWKALEDGIARELLV
jgi:hypothetical protein